MKKIKVLLISHNPFSTYQNMGKTFASLFASFSKEELCQLYIYPSYPDVDIADSYYRITDREAMKGILYRRNIGGEVFPHKYSGSIIENEAERKIYKNASNKFPTKRLLRDIMWKMSGWYSKELKEWIEREKPTCIFLAPGYAKFIYDIALKISKDYSIPIVTYICDDYYFVEGHKSFVESFQIKLLQRKIRRIMTHTKKIITISEEIKKNYTDEFSVESKVIMTGSSLESGRTGIVKEQIKVFSYFGNIGLGREKSLADIGRTLDEINREKSVNYYLNIYTGTVSTALDEAFFGIGSIKRCGFLVGEDFINEFLNADCLIHVESFDKKNMDLVKGSVSTKIADSLASGIPLLAYGPEGIASIEHLKRNNCAFVSTSLDTLKDTVCEVIDNYEERKKIVKTALKVAKKYHDSSVNSENLKSIIKEVQEQ